MKGTRGDLPPGSPVAAGLQGQRGGPNVCGMTRLLKLFDMLTCPLDGVVGPDAVAPTVGSAIDQVVAHPEDYDLAANYDPNKELERETPRD